MHVGRRLREVRLRAGLSAAALARRIGVSTSAVSQIERGVMQPSVSRLITITDALGAPMSAVLTARPDEPSDVAIERAADVDYVELGSGVVFRRLSPAETPGVDYFESVYPPGSTATKDGLFRHEGYEVGHVLSGELTIDFDDEIVVLRAGDSVTYPCSRPHRLHNTGTEPVVARWLIVHPA